MNRTRRAALGLALRYTATGLSLAVALVTVPIILRGLGPTRYGAFRVSQEYLGYLALLEFGLGGVLMVGFARAFAARDPVETRRLFRYGARAYLRLGVLSAIGIVAFVAAAPWLVRIPEAARDGVIDELRIGVLVGLISLLWVPLTPLRYLAEAEQRGYMVQIALILQAITTAGLAVLSAVTGGGLVGQFAAVVTGNAALIGFLVWDALRRHQDARPDGGTVAGPSAPPRDRWRMFVFALCSQMTTYSDTIIVSLVLGVDSVVPFTLTQRLLLLADGQILGIGAVTWAALAELHHRGEADRMNQRLVTLTRATAVLGFGILLPVAAATRAFIHLWVGPVGYGGAGLTAATFGWTCLHGLIALWAWPLMATGHVRRVLPVMLLGTLVSVTVSVLTTYWFGVMGPALGSLANYTLVAVWWLPFLLRRTFGTSVRALAGAAAGPAALAVPYAAGLFLLSVGFPVDELAVPVWARWVVLLGVMGVAAAVYCALAWFLVLPREDRAEFRARVFGR